jgi:predicted CoA-substrate-specific enzyme activase
MIYAGIDVGSISTEAVVVDDSGVVVGLSVGYTGADGAAAAERALSEAVQRSGLNRSDLVHLVATGYGRERVRGADDAVTEITCHARGAYSLFRSTRTVVDIGGQDSKVIRVDDNGRVADFQMNDKCAAGTGRFLEVMARALEVELKDMGPLGLQSRHRIRVSSVCTVFAESEVVGLIASGTPREDIIHGIHNAVADRTQGLLGRVGLAPELTVTGGVAKNIGLIEVLRERLGIDLNIPDEPQIAGALGAALIARDRATAP